MGRWFTKSIWFFFASMSNLLLFKSLVPLKFSLFQTRIIFKASNSQGHILIMAGKENLITRACIFLMILWCFKWVDLNLKKIYWYHSEFLVYFHKFSSNFQFSNIFFSSIFSIHLTISRGSSDELYSFRHIQKYTNGQSSERKKIDGKIRHNCLGSRIFF